MKKITFIYILFSIFITVNLHAQETNDRVKQILDSVNYKGAGTPKQDTIKKVQDQDQSVTPQKDTQSVQSLDSIKNSIDDPSVRKSLDNYKGNTGGSGRKAKVQRIKDEAERIKENEKRLEQMEKEEEERRLDFLKKEEERKKEEMKQREEMEKEAEKQRLENIKKEEEMRKEEEKRREDME